MKHKTRAVGRLVAVAVAALSLTSFVGIQSASAYTVGGCTGYCPGTVTWYDSPGGVTTNVTCRPGRLDVMPYASAMSGYVNGQYVIYRYHLTNNRGYYGTSGWSKAVLVPYTRNDQSVVVQTPRSPLPVTSFPVALSTQWTVQVQYGWYTANGYVYSGWAGRHPATGGAAISAGT